MKRLIIAMAVSAAFASVVVTSQSSTEVERHVAAAKLAAGTDHVGLFDRICAEAQQIATPRPRRTGPRPTPPRESWHAEPVQVFDNLYFLGMTEYSAWAVTTSDGIILIDAIFDYSVEDEIVDGLTVSTVAGKGVILDRTATTTCRGCMSGHRRQGPVWTSVRGADVKAVSPAERGRSEATRLDVGEHTRTLLA